MARYPGIHSIQNRLFLLLFSSMMTLLILVSFLYYQKTAEIIHSKISDLAEKNVSQTVGLFDLLLEGYDSVTKSLNSNYELSRLLLEADKETNVSVSVMNERSITNIIGAAYFSRDDIVGIHVMSKGGKLFNYERRFAGLVDQDYRSTDWYNKLVSSKGEMVWLGLSRGSVLNSFLQEEPVFIFGRQLYDLTNYKPVGVVLIETDPKPILSALSNASISPNSRVFIVNKTSDIIASTDEQQDDLSIEASGAEQLPVPSFSGLPRPKDDEIIVDNKTDNLIVAAKAAVAEWTVFALTPKSDISEELVQTRLYLLAVIIAVILLSIMLATLISRNISSPLKLLIREMKQVELGNFRGSVNVNSFEEINSLVSSFNRMVHRMDELIERITLSSISEKNAELQALQSQVNPHFLYNTLDMIYWMLDERENDRLGRVILSLSHMFRYSSDWQEASKTTLRQELEQMRHYMTIIENRLVGRVSTEIQVDPVWLDAIVPKMTIQPVIENAVKSGLEPLDRPGLLSVFTVADEEANELRIVIEDNGVGIEEEALTELQTMLRDSSLGRNYNAQEGGRRGIGLPNVHRRIVLMYGEPYGLRISSERGKGTTVVIAIPLPARGG
ncbi:sensor histidine kinase [Paenibacillus glycanilyticus]|uniref:histidine kinase n=1 Tax=Paenibacillus glycanilyticus TaxID=126569 RepID=A0ABQ6GGB3_9BACL|nr:sensor histidine kinase [Paenibacillus glycanilyticus]GLX69991.1 sensor histidine kinase YesM [Paenibacillus glycanilyticus]